MIYNYEWPKTTDDYAKLFEMKSFNLHEIYVEINIEDGK
jgi:hypothetical protein